MARPRAIVYIDGFNLYYGALKGTAFKWFDLQRYFCTIRQSDEIVAIKYFTAAVTGLGADRQHTYLAALRAACPLVTVILGSFKKKQVTCRYDGCTMAGAGPRRFTVPEEKRTDVNIGIHMVNDAHHDACDTFVLVSGDSDLVPAVHMVRSQFSTKKVFVYVPARSPRRGSAGELRAAANKHRFLPLAAIPKMLLPTSVSDGAGGSIQKPSEW